MKTSKYKTLRVNEDIHRKAKLSSSYKMIPLQKWLEQLIEREFKDMGLDKMNINL